MDYSQSDQRREQNSFNLAASQGLGSLRSSCRCVATGSRDVITHVDYVVDVVESLEHEKKYEKNFPKIITKHAFEARDSRHGDGEMSKPQIWSENRHWLPKH